MNKLQIIENCESCEFKNTYTNSLNQEQYTCKISENNGKEYPDVESHMICQFHSTKIINTIKNHSHLIDVTHSSWQMQNVKEQSCCEICENVEKCWEDPFHVENFITDENTRSNTICDEFKEL